MDKQFIQDLAAATGIQDQNQLQQLVQSLGREGLAQLYKVWQDNGVEGLTQAIQQLAKAQMARFGAKLNYIKYLRSL